MPEDAVGNGVCIVIAAVAGVLPASRAHAAVRTTAELGREAEAAFRVPGVVRLAPEAVAEELVAAKLDVSDH